MAEHGARDLVAEERLDDRGADGGVLAAGSTARPRRDPSCDRDARSRAGACRRRERCATMRAFSDLRRRQRQESRERFGARGHGVGVAPQFGILREVRLDAARRRRARASTASRRAPSSARSRSATACETPRATRARRDRACAAKTTVRYSPRNDPAAIGAVKTFWICAAVIGASVRAERQVDVRPHEAAGVAALGQPDIQLRLQQRSTASSVSDERAAISCMPPMCPNADNEATTAPGISSIERSSRGSPPAPLRRSSPAIRRTAMRSALLRASMMSVDSARHVSPARTARAPASSDGLAAAAGCGGDAGSGGVALFASASGGIDGGTSVGSSAAPRRA